MPTERKTNVYQLEFGGTSIGRRDAKPGEVKIWRTPMTGSRPRRGRIDEQGRLWFAEYGGNRIAMFDPASESIQEWMLPTPWSAPYDVVSTRSGEVWTGSMVTDPGSRLGTKSGAGGGGGVCSGAAHDHRPGVFGRRGGRGAGVWGGHHPRPPDPRPGPAEQKRPGWSRDAPHPPTPPPRGGGGRGKRGGVGRGPDE